MRIIKDEKAANALPFRSYVQGYDGFRHEKRGQPGEDKWIMVISNNGDPHEASGIEYPAKVLYVPTEDE